MKGGKCEVQYVADFSQKPAAQKNTFLLNGLFRPRQIVGATVHAVQDAGFENYSSIFFIPVWVLTSFQGLTTEGVDAFPQ